jgi:hypothetical protein
VAAITSSFIVDIETALCAEVLRLCGIGSEAYSDPDYLQLNVARRGMIVPDFFYQESELPVFICQYLFMEREPGGQVGGESFTHHWNCGVVFKLTPTIAGQVEPSEHEFYQCVMASADTMLRRVREILVTYAPSVIDSTFSEISDMPDVKRCRIWPLRDNEFAYTVMLLFEWDLTSEKGTVF